MPRLSVITITKNEAAHVPRALKSVAAFADDIVVVDSESTDETVRIAKTFTDKVIVHPWSGYGPQKNLAREHASGEWILQLDADEEVSPALRQEIRDVLTHPTHDFYWLPIVTEFLGKPLTHLRGKNLRLFRKAAGRWDDKQVHEQVERTPAARFYEHYARTGAAAGSASERLRRHSRFQAFAAPTVHPDDADSRLLGTPLIHHSHYQTLDAYRARQERYSSADAVQMLRTGRDRMGRPARVNPANPLSVLQFLTERAVRQFIRKFFRQRGFLDEWQGWLWCFLSAEYEYKMCRKYLELRRSPHRT